MSRIINLLREAQRPLLIRRFLHTRVADVIHERATPAPLANPAILDLVTVAFNTPWVIKEQAILLQKYLKDPFAYTVIDNSTDPDASEAIRKLCQSTGAGYIRLPRNPFRQPSDSHGLSLTWAWQHFLRLRNAHYIGFLDHDVFPIKETSVIPLISGAGAYGHQQDRPGMWYLWAGFCFFEREKIGQIPLNFLPTKGSDTGGRLWRTFYSQLKRETIPVADHHYGKIGSGDDPQTDLVEYFGDWLHVINGSNWKANGDKEQLVTRLLGKAGTI